ncbi:hypothetical protein [Conexibacter sp. S30A1]|uniref:hypothetical protein n=1 Tax=Conexibacter sp. S30A1 TaxID=2937800 RepID=UPI00200ECACA|nr:hypothetical protein [Conexibacter sp. S30A1]
MADTLDGDGGVIDEGTWVIEDRTTKALKTRVGLPVRLTTVRTPGEHGLIMAQRAECTAVVARRRTAEVARETLLDAAAEMIASHRPQRRTAPIRPGATERVTLDLAPAN